MVWIIRFVLIFVVTYFFMFIAKSLMRRVFNIEKESEGSPSQNYVKQRHQKVDKKFKDYSVVILFIILIVNLVYFAKSHYLFIIAVFIFTFIRMLIKAFFERKYSKHPKQSILTLTEMFVLLLVLIIILKFNLLY